ncbi:TetR/AcrR family transcriptional regulator [Vineibacter terrae]|uniref:TetR/AcrR family transcriptional regulator n=1 Tax=Vineibacter terrae TaxID=2586908 RepID=UPI002E3354B6|nr:TetR/AcrR family transcriptional regulator [Vineibacter terrae]HEX2889918.1 TetR/AcrR family transcriptional regulator [Vineibacter terrae]
MSQRERAKAERRARIVAAARGLVREGGIGNLSMKLLAERAGVGIATPYNLFGSKRDVMLAVLDEDVAAFQQRVARLRHPDALEVLFRTVTLAKQVYAAEPDFYRAVLLAVYNTGGREFRAMFSGPRRAFWLNLVGDAAAAGCIRPDVQAAPLTLHLAHVFASVLLDWVLGDIALDEMEAQIQYGFALSLMGVATAASRPAIEGWFERSERKVARFKRGGRRP